MICQGSTRPIDPAVHASNLNFRMDEYTVVLKGALHVEHEDGELDVRPGQAILVRGGEWVRYSTPDPEGAEYVAVCLPAFSMDTVHRDDG